VFSGTGKSILTVSSWRRSSILPLCGLLVRIDLASATAGVDNAGHPPPFQLRAGQVKHIRLEADCPSTMKMGGGYRVQALRLEVGDRLMFVTTACWSATPRA
jgi:Stage II sporulation protein E (SpoIIE)